MCCVRILFGGVFGLWGGWIYFVVCLVVFVWDFGVLEGGLSLGWERKEFRVVGFRGIITL